MKIWPITFGVFLAGLSNLSLGAQTPAPYTTVFYQSGGLRIEAYVYRPAGTGPFPVVIYSHGSRVGYEHEERPMQFVGTTLAEAGYLVLVPERRGYGKSDGATFDQEVGKDLGSRMTARFVAEADDVIAGITYAATIDGADKARIGLVGFSHGGVVSIRVASVRSDLRALVNQAGGSLTWPKSPELRRRLVEWARALKMPVLCLDATNDTTTEAVRTVCDAAHRAGAETAVKIYAAFSPKVTPGNIAPGHLIFTADGLPIWKPDVLGFLGAHLRSE